VGKGDASKLEVRGAQAKGVFYRNGLQVAIIRIVKWTTTRMGGVREEKEPHIDAQ